jgi:hypothetical protein
VVVSAFGLVILDVHLELLDMNLELSDIYSVILFVDLELLYCQIVCF